MGWRHGSRGWLPFVAGCRACRRSRWSDPQGEGSRETYQSRTSTALQQLETRAAGCPTRSAETWPEPGHQYSRTRSRPGPSVGEKCARSQFWRRRNEGGEVELQIAGGAQKFAEKQKLATMWNNAIMIRGMWKKWRWHKPWAPCKRSLSNMPPDLRPRPAIAFLSFELRTQLLQLCHMQVQYYSRPWWKVTFEQRCERQAERTKTISNKNEFGVSSILSQRSILKTYTSTTWKTLKSTWQLAIDSTAEFEKFLVNISFGFADHSPSDLRGWASDLLAFGNNFLVCSATAETRKYYVGRLSKEARNELFPRIKVHGYFAMQKWINHDAVYPK